ncbi:hypothetical protein R0J91_22850, partial [Micrococcus sp. SIMBA_131]
GAALKIAVIYPLFLLLLQWGVTGADTGIGTVPVLDAEQSGWLRAAEIGPLAIFLVARILAPARQSRFYEQLRFYEK